MAIEHMVWIKFNDGVSGQRIADHLSNLASLRDKVPCVVELTVGENFTDRAGGFTHGLYVRVGSRDDLAAYLEHPDHVAAAGPLKADAELRAMDIEG